MPKLNFFTFKIGGMAGQGIKSAGLTFCKIATRSGYHVYTHTEYPSLIRGGHNVMQISVGDSPMTAPSRHTDFLVALNQETITLHYQELVDGAGVIFDADSKLDTSKIPSSVHLFPVPLAKFAREEGGGELMSNTVALGAAMALLSGEMQHLKDLIAQEFGDKKPEVVELNHKAAQAGYDFAKANYDEYIRTSLFPHTHEQQPMVVNGNEAVSMGAIAAGMQFASIYPMTPTSNILHILAPYQEKYGYIYKQPEDEIAAINMAIGAAHAGLRAMTATSGGGFCLMAEGYGLAGMTETPVVIIEGMRGAPATGNPTWTEQGDLRFVLSAHQGDFPRIVLAAGDVEEAFHQTTKAFNLAEKYQTPVLILVDKHLCENDQSVIPFDISSYEVSRGKFTTEKVEDYQRYALSDDGISLRVPVGSGNHFLANSDEHNTYGYDDDSIETRNQQMKKRMKKLETCAEEDMETPILFGPQDADITLISWGSNKGAIIEALKYLPTVNYLHLTWINPFPAEAVAQALHNAKYLINIECNYTAQMASLIREKTGIEILDHILKYDGRPLYPEEIIEKVAQVLRK